MKWLWSTPWTTPDPTTVARIIPRSAKEGQLAEGRMKITLVLEVEDLAFVDGASRPKLNPQGRARLSEVLGDAGFGIVSVGAGSR